MQSLSPKDWINVDELTLEKQFNLLKKKKMISFDIKIHLTINETLTVSRKINYLRWIIKVINNKKKRTHQEGMVGALIITTQLLRGVECIFEATKVRSFDLTSNSFVRGDFHKKLRRLLRIASFSSWNIVSITACMYGRPVEKVSVHLRKRRMRSRKHKRGVAQPPDAKVLG